MTKRKSGTEYSKIQDKINKKVGKIGEDAAKFFIATELKYTEVKTRSSVEFGSPSQAVTLNKRVCIRAGAEGYLKRNCYNLYPRFDVIEVVVNNNDLKVESVNHIDNAFDINARVIR